MTTATEETFDGKGDLKIYLRSWTPDGAPRAIVVICHGVNSHGGQYPWPAGELVKKGHVVFALDLRGRGKSEGERFYVEDIADYVADVSSTVKIAKARHPGLPVFLLGHSAGVVVSATYTLDNQAEIAGFICESFAFQVPAPGFALAAIKGLSHIAPHLPVLKLKNEDFSRDPATVAALNADPLIAHEVQPAATVAALVRAERAPARGVSQDHLARPHHARHRGQGDGLRGPPVPPRHGGLHRQNAEALQGPLPRPAGRYRQGRRDSRHHRVDRRASALARTPSGRGSAP